MSPSISPSFSPSVTEYEDKYTPQGDDWYYKYDYLYRYGGVSGVRYHYGDLLRYGGRAATVFAGKYSVTGDTFIDKYSPQEDEYYYKYLYRYQYGGEGGVRYTYGQHLRYGGREGTTYTNKYPLY